MDRKTTAKDDQPYDQHCLMDKRHRKYVKFCFFNAPSLRNKIAEVSEFVNINNVDILAVVETWFNHLDRDVTLPDSSHRSEETAEQREAEYVYLYRTKYPA